MQELRAFQILRHFRNRVRHIRDFTQRKIIQISALASSRRPGGGRIRSSIRLAEFMACAFFNALVMTAQHALVINLHAAMLSVAMG